MCPKCDINKIPGQYNKRVIIGGNYNFMANIKEISKYVEEFDFQPIVAYDFDVPETNIHDCDLLLLHNCKYAIFDVTAPAGELMELGRCRDYGTKVVAVYQVREKEKTPEQVSSMILTSGVQRKGYHDFTTLKKYVKDFLLEEEGRFELYLKVYGYKFKNVEMLICINQDGTSDHHYHLKGLEVVNENLILTQEGPHYFEIDEQCQGKIIEGPTFHTTHENLVEWKEASRKKSDKYSEGIVNFKEGLTKKHEAVDYLIKIKYENDVCLTKEEFDRVYQDEDFPYEYSAVTVKYPTESLRLKIKFFDGYEVNMQPLAWYGTQVQKDAITGASVEFKSDGNEANLIVNKPKILHTYLIFWESMSKEKFDILGGKE